MLAGVAPYFSIVDTHIIFDYTIKYAKHLGAVGGGGNLGASNQIITLYIIKNKTIVTNRYKPDI
jgi:hypothetical protein